MEAKTKDLWVFVETNEDGTAKNVGIELLTPGKMMAGKQGGALVAVVIGSGVDEAVKAASEHGADKVIVVDGPEYKHYTTDAYAIALVTLVEKYGPTSMLIGATNNGRDLGPGGGGRLHTGLTADCTGLDIDEETGNVAWTRPAFGGNLMATILCPDHRPQIGTVRPGVFKKGDAAEGKAEIVKEDIHVAEDQIRTQVLTSRARRSSCPAGAAWAARRALTPSSLWPTCWGPPWARPAPPWTRAGSPTPIRWGRPARRWVPSCTSPAASAAPSSTWRA